ncbi:MAG: dTDP-4-dehydrorhamnose reductase [Pricia sp.]|nr:dTDP-4-dehydrorhamnose reductase [Pricia sp.]
MLKILVTGGNGQLASCIKEVSLNYADALDFVYKSSSELDVSNTNAVDKVFSEQDFDYCINGAAFTDVDDAEKEKERSESVNRDGSKNLARACEQHNSVLIHISTDFVFDGRQSTPYTEHDSTNPLSQYGKTKLLGEQEIQSICKKYFIVRTSWLYSEYGNNFLKSMLKYSGERDQLSVVFDQVGTPTYARDLAEVLLAFIKNSITDYGIYHYSNEGVASWYDFAKAIFEINHIELDLKPIRSFEYPLPAKRPSYSVLDKSKIKATLNIEIPYWMESLIRACKAL